jgi:hypothetical protein
MSAVSENVRDLAGPDDAAAEIGRLNDRLASHPTIPPDIADSVRSIAAAVEQTALPRWESVDPHHALILLHASLAAQRAVDDPESPAARDRLRIALESIRQSLTAIAEREPIADERSPKELVRWLVEATEVPQGRLAELIGVSQRQFQRWASPSESAQPEAEDARKVRAVARLVNQLRFVLTPAGTIDWFGWPRADLQGRTPSDLLDEPQGLPELTRIAASMRSSYAS